MAGEWATARASQDSPAIIDAVGVVGAVAGEETIVDRTVVVEAINAGRGEMRSKLWETRAM